ncbi:MAG TPA: alpha/beta hydrolase [Alphaproteobacteria bacterium]|jgi:pimeloyl-ACP methyl ester carboxylesterase
MLKEEAVTLPTQDGASVEMMLHYDDALPQTVAITVMHPTSDWRRHFMSKHLAARGIAVLGCSTRYSTREAELILEETLLDMAAGVKFLRDKGYKHVLSIGSSGGAEIIAAYQSEALKPQIKLTGAGAPLDFAKLKLPPFDGLVFLNPHMGRPFSMTRNLDPSVGGEDGNDPLIYDADLDMYNPKNGPPYSEEFRTRYETAQVERNHKITRWVQKKLKEIEKTGNPHIADIPFIVHRTSADLHFLDKSLNASDRSGETIWDEKAEYSNYTPGPLRGNKTRLRVVTLRSWLSQRSQATSHFDVLKHIPNCKVPVIMICGTAEQGGPSHAKQIYDAIPDPQKEFVWVKDATHFMTKQDKQQAETAVHIDNWLQKRGLK